MTIKAILRFYRQSPRKVRLVVDAIRGLGVIEAEGKLSHLARRASGPVLKLLRSAMANAKHNHGLEGGVLFVKEIRVDQGPTFKRWMPRAHGRATPLRKRTSHVTIILAEREPGSKSKDLVSKSEKEIISKKEVEVKVDSKVKSETKKEVKNEIKKDKQLKESEK